MLYTQNFQSVKNSTFPNRKYIFPNSSINLQVVEYILHYVKPEMWAALFDINYLSYFEQWNLY